MEVAVAPPALRWPAAGSAASAAVWLAGAAVLVALFISANLLTWLDIPYTKEGGGWAFKLHPCTWITMIAALLMAVARGPWQLAVGAPGVVLFLAAILFCVVFAGLMTGVGNLIVLLDNFLPAGLMALVLGQATPGQRAALAWAMRGAFAINAVLALVEAVMQATLIPLYLDGEPYRPLLEDFRPTALYDHPLTGGVMTMLGLALAPPGAWLRPAYTALLGLALVVFGGRMAVAAALLAGCAIPLARLARQVLTRRGSGGQPALLGALAALLAGLPIGALCMSAGLGERLYSHLYWDSSAQARLTEWGVLAGLDESQWVFGTARSDLLAKVNALRLDAGVEVIENFWLLMLVSLGGVAFVVFAIGLFALLASCWRGANVRGRILLVSVLAVASTSNSLGRKSTILVCLIAAVACLPSARPQTDGWHRFDARGPAPA
jgi:hypothetical protein